MSIDLTNEKGDYWQASNSTWSAILGVAEGYGWQPAGTILYRHSGLHPDMEVLDLDVDSPGVLASSGEGMRVIIEETDGDGKVVWNVVNQSGRKLASGIYICRATNNKGEEKFFKLAVIR